MRRKCEEAPPAKEKIEKKSESGRTGRGHFVCGVCRYLREFFYDGLAPVLNYPVCVP